MIVPSWLWLRIFVVLLCAGLFFGCAGRLGPDAEQPAEAFEQQAENIWTLFQARYMGHCPARDFSVRASAMYENPEQSSRVVLRMWGRTDFPIRLDVQAGIGAMLAHWREDEHGWGGYAPGREQAFVARDVRAGAEMMGMLMPLRLDSLARMLAGCWQDIVPPDYDRAVLAGDEPEYVFQQGQSRFVLRLAMDGRPIVFSRIAPQGWSVRIDQWMDSPGSSPRRLTLRQGDQSAVLRLRSVDFFVDPWTPSELALDLPAGTTFFSPAP